MGTPSPFAGMPSHMWQRTHMPATFALVCAGTHTRNTHVIELKCTHQVQKGVTPI